MKTQENYTIIHVNTHFHYDTNEERFLSTSWGMSYDSKSYLEMLIQNNPEKFDGCKIFKTK